MARLTMARSTSGILIVCALVGTSAFQTTRRLGAVTHRPPLTVVSHGGHDHSHEHEQRQPRPLPKRRWRRKDGRTRSVDPLVRFRAASSAAALQMHSPLSRDAMRKMFDRFDQDGSGSVDASELNEVMRGLGKHLSEAELSRMVSEADKNGDGEIDFDEFAAVLKAVEGERGTSQAAAPPAGVRKIFGLSRFALPATATLALVLARPLMWLRGTAGGFGGGSAVLDEPSSRSYDSYSSLFSGEISSCDTSSLR